MVGSVGSCGQIMPDVVSYNPDTGALTGVSVHNHNGYLRCTYQGKKWLVHRLAFHLMGEEVPEQVDHISGDKTDNRWCNLRPADYSINSRNRPKYRNNKSGVTGVYWNKATQKWRVHIGVGGGKEKHLGLYGTLLDAVAARIRAEKEYDFHENHGREAIA